MFKKLLLGCLPLFWLSLGSQVVLAQGTTATISGTVKDETGAILPGVTVTVKSTDTGQTRTAITDDEGRYVVPELPPGTCEVTASLAGFQTAVRVGISLTVGRHAIVDTVLKVGAVEEKVLVSGEAPLVETTSSSLSGLVGDKQIRDLPLNGRNFVQLTLLETGVVQARSAGTSAIVGTGLKTSFHGSRMDFNNFMMDGTSINSVNQESIGGSSGQAMGVETIREFQVITSNFSAEFGRAGGGVINVVTKSGTNQLHGALFYFHRNDNLDGRNFFDRSGAPEFKRHQFGLAVGGPINRDKTFFFGGYEGLREGLGQTLIANVPTVAARQGVLPSGTLIVASGVKPYLDLFPLPNGRTFADGIAEFIRADTQTTNQNFYQIRIDHAVSDSDSLFARYTIDDSHTDTPQLIPTFLLTDAVRSQYLTLEEKRILSPTLLNIFRFGLNRTAVSYIQIPLDPRASDPALWFTQNQSVPGLGVLSITGVTNPSGVQNRPNRRADNVFQWTDTLSRNVAAHSLKVGGEVQRVQTNEAQTNLGQGSFAFANLRSFLLAQPTTFTGVAGGSDWPRGWRQSLLGLFVQDDIRVRPNLTLNLGVRWEFTTNPNEVNGKASHINNPITDRTYVVGNPEIRFPKDNIAPRVGFAWDPSGDGKTSIRGGFGVFDQMIFRYWYWTSGNTIPPFIQSLSTSTPFISFPNPFAAGLSQQAPLAFDLVEYNTKSVPYMMQYNLAVQKELMWSTVLTLGYVGSRGLHLGRFNDVNNAVPAVSADGRKFFAAGLQRRNSAWGQVRYRTLQSSSEYNSLQIKVAHRLMCQVYSYQNL